MDCPRSPLTEIVDAVAIIKAHNELKGVLSSPRPFDNGETHSKISGGVLQRVFDNACAIDESNKEILSKNSKTPQTHLL